MLSQESSKQIFDLESSYHTPDIPTGFTKNVIICVLSDLVHQLSILKSINSQNDLPHSLKSIQYQSIEERYVGQENHSECRISSTNSNYDKLSADIALLHDVLIAACEEIKDVGKSAVLDEAIRNIRRMHDDEEQLLKEEQTYKKVISDLEHRREEERLENIHTIEGTNAKIQKLKFEVEDIYIYGQHEVDYFDKWEKTRIEQNKIKCAEKENRYSSVITDTQNRINLENRCHAEFVRYLDESKDDYLDEIQYWMKRYDEEMEQREGDMINLKADLEKIVEERAQLEQEYAKRTAAINDWLEYKRIKKEKADQIQKEEDAAIRIQAWWRGVMFRKKLGPYAKKKKGKGKDQKKKK